MDIYFCFKKEPLKLALGTVQFGLNYGINNTSGIPVTDELIDLFNLAAKEKIEYLDTAHGYGDAEIKIGKFADNRFKVISKFSKCVSEQVLLNQFEQTLQSVKQHRIYGYMAHNANDLIERAELWDAMLALKNKNRVEKIGYSLYTPEQLELLLLKGMVPDIVQLPYSLLDRKFESCFAKLKNVGTEIHVRSVFLQGLYFIGANHLPVKLLALKNSLNELNSICEDKGVSRGSLALNFVAGNPLIDKVVIGVDSAFQLKENIELVDRWVPDEELIDSVKKIEVSHPELLNPVNW
uniref:aldo/keto reductase n=1 Tax=Algoriphagus sp. TaxID=1872435 RepID=UPI0040472D18